MITDQERLYALLKSAGERGMAIDELVDGLYGQRFDGGPTWARTCIHVMKHKLNRKLVCERIEVKFDRTWARVGRRYLRGGKARYQLIQL